MYKRHTFQKLKNQILHLDTDCENLDNSSTYPSEVKEKKKTWLQKNHSDLAGLEAVESVSTKNFFRVDLSFLREAVLMTGISSIRIPESLTVLSS